MSFIRARPKIAVTIPPKRRPAAASVQPSSESNANEVNTLSSNDPVTKPDAVLETTSPLPQKDKDTAGNSTSNESKQFFKRIKPAVQVPIKKSRVRPACLDADKPKPPLYEPTKTHEVLNLKKEPVPSEVQVTEERPVTPPPPTAVISSPAKSPVRHRFARPATTDPIARRLSVHVSSASESEDDCRRNIVSRMRKISENSVFSKITNVEEQVIDDPADENECVRLALLPKKRKTKVSNHVRKIAEARRNFNRRFCRETPDRSNLKMFDLLFYNPNTPDENKVPAAQSEMKPLAVDHEEILREEVVDEPELKEEQDASEAAMPVPQVKIGANGEIILDEKSLVIETTDARKCREALKNSVPVFEDRIKRSSYYGKKHNKPKDWSPVELKCFYKALNSIGTDFALMEALFPGRNRAQLKNKFKREEKVNKALIEKALSQPTSFNIAVLKEEFELERAHVEKETQKKLNEIQRLAQDRKENVARDCKEVDDAVVRQRVLGNEYHETRRSKRKSVSRKLSSDFIESFDSDETEQCPISENKKVKVQVPVIHVPPANSEEKTEDIPQEEFFKLFKANLENMQPTTVTIQAPSDDNTTVRLVIDAEEEVYVPSTAPHEMETVFLLQEEHNPSDVIDNSSFSEPLVSNETTESVITEREVSHRTIGAFNYFLFKNEESFESQMNQMQELKAGSIVVMFSDTPDIPLEHRLSTFMMVDKQSEHGVQVSAMPAVLPPELRQLVLNDFIQS